MNKQQYWKLQLKKDLSDRKIAMIKCLQKFQIVKSVLNCVYISLVFCYFKWGASLYPTLYLTHIVSLHPCFLDLPAWKYLLSLSFCFVLFDILLRYWLNLAFELQAQAVEAGGAVVSNLGHSISILCWNHKSLKMKAKAKTHAYISWLVGCHILIQNRAVGGRGGGDSCDIFLSNFRVDILIIMIKNYICGFLIINNTRPSKLYLCQLIQHEDTGNLEVLP